ncbi:CpaF family protein [Hypericibacter sp.]|uniref:CpaF family protein n=1 Tax=Hypericibacter sp. TaxID=2705401 RepID=UPI003D6D24BC
MAPDDARDRAAPAPRGSELIARIAQELHPVVDRFFSGRDVLTLSRQSLAIEVGQAVTTVLDGRQIPLNLLERRNLIAQLMTNLLAAAEVKTGTPLSAAAPGDVEAIVQDTLAADPGSSPRPTPAPAPASTQEPVQEPQPASRPQSTAESLTPKAPERKVAGSRHIEIAKDQIQALVVERIDLAAAVKLERGELGRQVAQIAQEVLAEQKIRLNQREQRDLTELLLDDMLGLGPLEPLLADETITDIMVNGPNQVYVERGGKLVVTDIKFRNNQHVMNVATRIVSQVGRRVDESVPLCDARLMDGSRVNIIIPPLAIDGPSISIRKFSKKGITLDVMARQKNISDPLATVLKIASRAKLNILISGGTGSGKTTLLNAMSQMIDNGDRIVTIEDAAELQLQQPHVVRLETRPANLEGEGEITMRDLVKNALRMRPDRIILGEVRGSEAVDMLQAMNTGHEGSMSTIHANRPREALTRLENMVGMAGINLPAKAVRTQVSAAIDIIVQISRMRDGVRRITHVVEVVGMEGDVIITQDLFTYEFEGEEPDGKLRGQFKSSGLRPHFTPKAAYFGLDRALLEVI